MCHNPDLLDEFLPYLLALFISAVLIIPLQVLITFLPAFGKPREGSALNITANAVNLVMDYQ